MEAVDTRTAATTCMLLSQVLDGSLPGGHGLGAKLC